MPNPKRTRRSRRIRLSFIGGRRPSLLPSPNLTAQSKKTKSRLSNEMLEKENSSSTMVKRQTEKQESLLNQEVLKDNNCTSDTETVLNKSNQMHSEQDEEENVHITSHEVDRVQSVLHSTYNRTETNESYSKVSPKYNGYDSKVRTSMEELQAMISLTETQKSNKVKQLNIEMENELQEWKRLMRDNKFNGFVSYFEREISESTELTLNVNTIDFDKELDQLENMLDLFACKSRNLYEQHKKLQRKKEILQDSLNRKCETLIMNNSFDTVIPIETPRTLIKKIIKEA